jgi:hypothetical protein
LPRPYSPFIRQYFTFADFSGDGKAQKNPTSRRTSAKMSEADVRRVVAEVLKN